MPGWGSRERERGWFYWNEEDGSDELHYAPVGSTASQRTACDQGVPFWATRFGNVDVDVDPCAECLEEADADP